MKFSPGAVKHINLLDTDIGRPISHISTNIKFETIIADTKLVLEKGIVISKEIEAENGKWYQVMVMPYVQSSHKNKGAIITFNDITELKATQSELKNKNQSLSYFLIRKRRNNLKDRCNLFNIKLPAFITPEEIVKELEARTVNVGTYVKS